jgi:hypothetical protein
MANNSPFTTFFTNLGRQLEVPARTGTLTGLSASSAGSSTASLPTVTTDSASTTPRSEPVDQGSRAGSLAAERPLPKDRPPADVSNLPNLQALNQAALVSSSRPVDPSATFPDSSNDSPQILQSVAKSYYMCVKLVM